MYVYIHSHIYRLELHRESVEEIDKLFQLNAYYSSEEEEEEEEQF